MCSVSRARADSSPLPQAFNRFVISAGRAWMDGPFFKKYTRNVAGFGRRLPTVRVEESKSLPKTGGTNEIRRNFGGDAQCRSRKRLRTTDARKRKHVVFRNCRRQHDRPQAAQHKHRSGGSCWERYARPVHLSSDQGERK